MNNGFALIALAGLGALVLLGRDKETPTPGGEGPDIEPTGRQPEVEPPEQLEGRRQSARAAPTAAPQQASPEQLQASPEPMSEPAQASPEPMGDPLSSAYKDALGSLLGSQMVQADGWSQAPVTMVGGTRWGPS